MLPVFSVGTVRYLLSLVKPSCLTQFLRFVPVKRTARRLHCFFSESLCDTLARFLKVFLSRGGCHNYASVYRYGTVVPIQIPGKNKGFTFSQSSVFSVPTSCLLNIPVFTDDGTEINSQRKKRPQKSPSLFDRKRPQQPFWSAFLRLLLPLKGTLA